MGLPTEILRFFNTSNATKVGNKLSPKSIEDFCNNKPDLDILEVKRICQKFENEGLLIHYGKKSDMPLIGDCYYNLHYIEKQANYGSYDFLINGFLSIRDHFYNSVRPVIVKDKRNDDGIGTCFVIGKSTVVTALHCIDEMECIIITDEQNNTPVVKRIIAPIDKRKDIAVIEFEGTPFATTPHLIIGSSRILDQVLTLGYPPISGFDSIQAAELATINTFIKSSKGYIIGQEKSYLDEQNYLLLNARVKGGNSGGPIINKFGHVIGMLVNIPTDPNDPNKIDLLGYGLAIPGTDILNMFKKIVGGDGEFQTINFTMLKKGFKTKK